MSSSSYRKKGIMQLDGSLEGPYGAVYMDSIIVNTTGRPGTFKLGLEPTLTVNRQSLVPINMTPNSPCANTNFTCVNFAASGPAVLQSSTLVVGQMYLFANSSGFSKVSLSLDNNALILGVLSYDIKAGAYVELLWDGSNLT